MVLCCCVYTLPFLLSHVLSKHAVRYCTCYPPPHEKRYHIVTLCGDRTRKYLSRFIEAFVQGAGETAEQHEREPPPHKA